MEQKLCPKCIIFDCDGVLVDSETIGIQALLDLSAKYGFSIPLDQAIKLFKGLSLTAQFSFIEKNISRRLPADFENRYRKYSFELFRKNIKPIVGAEEFLKNLSIPFCIASNGPREKMQITLTGSGLSRYFNQNIFSGYDIQKFKPEPAIFVFAAQEMGCEISECLVIDDSSAGIDAAIAGGFQVIGFNADENMVLFGDIPMVKTYAELEILFDERIFCKPK